jgi:hypothetical protein
MGILRRSTRRLQQLGRLNAAEIAALAEAQLLLVRAQWRVWTGTRGSFATSPPSHGEQTVSDGQVAIATNAERAISRAARFGIFRPACLVRSVALERMLERRGIPGARIRVGVRKDGTAFTAHSWVELGGRVFGDDGADYRRFETLADIESERQA